MHLPDLHRGVQHPSRVAILVALQARGAATFPAIRDEVGLTDGNLNRHLKVLVEEGWVASRRSGLGRGSTTMLEIAEAGSRGLETFRNWCLEVAGKIQGGESGLGPSRGLENPTAAVVIDDRSRGWAD